MANSLLQPSEITAIPLAVAHTNIKFAKATDMSYGSLYGNSGVSLSGKAGQTIQIRLPNKYLIRRGSALSVQAQSEQSVAISVADQFGIDTQFSDVELTLLVDDYEKRYGEPAGLTMATTVDSDGVNGYSNSAGSYNGIAQTYNGYLFDATSAVTAQKSILQLKRMLEDQNIPIGNDISFVIPTVGEAIISPQYINVFNPTSVISSINKEGVMSQVGGLNWYMDQVMPNITTGDRSSTTCTTAAAVTVEGSSTISIATSGATSKIYVGEIFTIAGCYSVNPETKLSTGNLQTFAVQPQTSTVAGAGTFTAAATNASVFSGYYTAVGSAVTVTVSPVMYSSASFGLQNLSNLPGNSKALTFVGAASQTYAQAIMMHKTAYALASVQLEDVGGVEVCKRSKLDGMTLRYIRGWDITNGVKFNRYDSLIGYAATRPEWSGRMFIPLS